MSIDFREIAERFGRMGTGPRAELRRCATPDDVAMVPSFYRLLPGIKTDIRWHHLVFFLPYATHKENTDSLGKQLAKGNVSEKRLFQVIRSETPNDLIQLRRLIQQVEPQLDWQQFGETLFFWNEVKKRRLLEDFFMHQSTKNK